MEKVATDDDDRPIQEVKFLKATVFVNPYKEMEEAEKKQAEQERLKVRPGLGGAGGWRSHHRVWK